MKSDASSSPVRLQDRLAALWPQWPLGISLALAGFLNILEGLSLPLTLLQRVGALNSLAESVSALGGTAQVLLGLMLVVAGVGLVRRLSFAWTLAILLLVITLGVNVARAKWGASLVLPAVMLGSLLLVKRRFTRRTALTSFLLSTSGVIAVLAYGTAGAYLLGAGFHPPIQDLSTALYFTVVSLSTVGYGDIVPATIETRWFVVSLLVVGLGVFASAIASALGPKLTGELQRIFKPKDKPVEPDNHVILAGEGAIARNVARELHRRGVPLVQIVARSADVSTTGHRLVEGDATDDAILQQAGIERARLVIAAREDDGDNALIALVSKDLNPKVRLLAVASSALSIRRLKLARADLVFSPAAVGSRLLADLVEGSRIPAEFQDLLEGQLEQIR